MSYFTEYQELLKTARRQFGQFKSLAGALTPEEAEIAFSELYRPIYKQTPSARNVAALKKRIEGMTRRKAKNAFNKDTEKRKAIENFKAELFEHTKTQIGEDGDAHGLGDTAKGVQTVLYNFFDDAFSKSMMKLGVSRVYNSILDDTKTLRRKIARLVAIMYSSEYREHNGRIDLAKATDVLYEVCEKLRYSKSNADNALQTIRKILDESEEKKTAGQHVGLKKVKKP